MGVEIANAGDVNVVARIKGNEKVAIERILFIELVLDLNFINILQFIMMMLKQIHRTHIYFSCHR
ncbi:MAG: hypothetical protein BA866_09360 [Desulfobulbaceae bacterium S5133MH15]|nr:MAG: hypothetical protein BA866_09360 [Desulfobulbaceae bacterium S5133MH15]